MLAEKERLLQKEALFCDERCQFAFVFNFFSLTSCIPGVCCVKSKKEYICFSDNAFLPKMLFWKFRMGICGYNAIFKIVIEYPIKFSIDRYNSCRKEKKMEILLQSKTYLFMDDALMIKGG